MDCAAEPPGKGLQDTELCARRLGRGQWPAPPLLVVPTPGPLLNRCECAFQAVASQQQRATSAAD